jgi:Recombination endonuclease VII
MSRACEACGDESHSPVADHCHKHGWIRGTLCRVCSARMALIDRGVLANGTEIEALLAIARRCLDCPPVTVADLAPARGGRNAPVRMTADLDASLYGFLRGYAQARDVAVAHVIRELIRQVRADPDLSAKVTAELERRREAFAEAMRAARE